MDRARLDGELLGFTYQAEDSAFAVGRIRLESGEEAMVVGPIGGALPGQQVVMTGRFEVHPAHGRQFRVQTLLTDDPRSVRGLGLYLASGAVRGLGPELARRLVDRFGLDLLAIMEESPERLREVPGIGDVRLESILESWRQNRTDRELEATLRGQGLTPGLTRRIMERFGADAPVILQRNPYSLIGQISGVAFRTADSIARQNGIGADHPHRAEAALHYCLQRAREDGHCFLPEGELLEKAVHLDVPANAARAGLERLLDQGFLVAVPTSDPTVRPVLLPDIHRLEAAVAGRLLEMVGRRPHPTLMTVADLEQVSGVRLDPSQRLAVELALQEGVVVVTGGPGTGKTTIVKVLLAAARRMGETWKLGAPTGRAARRMAEACGQEATTIHRLLEFAWPEMKFRRNRSNPLEAGGVIVDEVSMLDLPMAASLLEAMPPRGRLVLVGDAHQLPAVGPGQVLADIIDSGVVPVVRLEQIHRQAEGSGIVVNAHRVDSGSMPVSSEKEPDRSAPSAPEQQDFFMVERKDPLELAALLVEVVTRRLPARGFDPLSDVQVLVPMHRGELGTIALNRRLQDVLNHTGEATRHGERVFRVGDRVIQTRNDYKVEVFNGEVGRIVEVGEGSLSVAFDGRTVSVVGDQLDHIELAYAITVHKSQGSEYPAVVVVLHPHHTIMLRRNLLYTAITRARSFCCVLGPRNSVRLAVGISGRRDRYTLLPDRLRSGDLFLGGHGMEQP